MNEKYILLNSFGSTQTLAMNLVSLCNIRNGKIVSKNVTKNKAWNYFQALLFIKNYARPLLENKLIMLDI